jgi:hypothetical protein
MGREGGGGEDLLPCSQGPPLVTTLNVMNNSFHTPLLVAPLQEIIPEITSIFHNRNFMIIEVMMDSSSHSWNSETQYTTIDYRCG